MALTTADARTQLAEDGYAVVEDVIAAGDFDPIYAEWDEILGELAEGTVTSTQAGLPFAERLLALCDETGLASAWISATSRPVNRAAGPTSRASWREVGRIPSGCSATPPSGPRCGTRHAMR